MLVIKKEFGIEDIDEKRILALPDAYKKQLSELTEKIYGKKETSKSETIRKALDDVTKGFKDWWSVELEASKFKKSDSQKADSIYKNGIKQFSQSAPLLGSYAIFLCDIRKDYDRAEEYYKRSLEADPNHANNLGNYSGFLLGYGRMEEGFEYLEKAKKIAEKKALILECLYYEYAHTKDAEKRKKSLEEIRKMIEAGDRSPGWDLSMNVERAKKEGHPAPELLETLAKVIAEEVDASELHKFAEYNG